MKKPILLLVVLLFCSCSDIIENAIENAIPEPETLEIGIKNNSSVVFNRIEITTKSGLRHVFQVTDPTAFSEFQVSDFSYSEAEIIIMTEHKNYAFSPLFYDESTKENKGRFYYDISIENNTLLITRHKF
ncbi:MAG: hypothetical protein KDC81_04710 [Flavobacteriaceae bacterium]|nr:hypothetical protein [Flavobacteriaceae bacterium]